MFSDSELEEGSVTRKFRITVADGKSYHTQHYNLAAIIAVGYKERAVQFRKWATGIIEQFTIKAYVMDDERIKSGGFHPHRAVFRRAVESRFGAGLGLLDKRNSPFGPAQNPIIQGTEADARNPPRSRLESDDDAFAASPRSEGQRLKAEGRSTLGGRCQGAALIQKSSELPMASEEIPPDLLALAQQLHALREQARELGLLTNDRELQQVRVELTR